MKSKSFILAAAVLAMILTIGLTNALAADYPKRPISLICPWGAGGGTDAVSRIIATLLKKELGVPVNVVNRTGGSGAVGHTAMATAKPDGYTIGMPTVEITMMHWMGLTEITYKDMTPVAMVNFDPAGINVLTDILLENVSRSRKSCSRKPRQADGFRYRSGRHLASGHGRLAQSDRSASDRH